MPVYKCSTDCTCGRHKSKGKKRSFEVRQKISATKKGVAFTSAHKQALSIAKTTIQPEERAYTTAHHYVVKDRGPASDYPCFHQDDDCSHRMEWANLTGNYGDINDYKPLCRVHHSRYDNVVPSKSDEHIVWVESPKSNGWGKK